MAMGSTSFPSKDRVRARVPALNSDTAGTPMAASTPSVGACSKTVIVLGAAYGGLFSLLFPTVHLQVPESF